MDKDVAVTMCGVIIAEGLAILPKELNPKTIKLMYAQDHVEQAHKLVQRVCTQSGEWLFLQPNPDQPVHIED